MKQSSAYTVSAYNIYHVLCRISQTCPSHLSENEQIVLDRRCLQVCASVPEW